MVERLGHWSRAWEPKNVLDWSAAQVTFSSCALCLFTAPFSLQVKLCEKWVIIWYQWTYIHERASRACSRCSQLQRTRHFENWWSKRDPDMTPYEVFCIEVFFGIFFFFWKYSQLLRNVRVSLFWLVVSLGTSACRRCAAKYAERFFVIVYWPSTVRFPPICSPQIKPAKLQSLRVVKRFCFPNKTYEAAPRNREICLLVMQQCWHFLSSKWDRKHNLMWDRYAVLLISKDKPP